MSNLEENTRIWATEYLNQVEMKKSTHIDLYTNELINRILKQCPAAEINYYDKVDYKQKYEKLLSLMKRVNEELFGEVKFIDNEEFESLKKEIQDAIDEKE